MSGLLSFLMSGLLSLLLSKLSSWLLFLSIALVIVKIVGRCYQNFYRQSLSVLLSVAATVTVIVIVIVAVAFNRRDTYHSGPDPTADKQ